MQPLFSRLSACVVLARFWLRSGTTDTAPLKRNVLYAIPISSTILLALLRATREDLSYHDQDAETKSYSFKNTAWSFHVVIAKGTLKYSLILSAARRLLRLTLGQRKANVTWTRVGVIFPVS